jgi:hypothetical protein
MSRATTSGGRPPSDAVGAGHESRTEELATSSNLCCGNEFPGGEEPWPGICVGRRFRWCRARSAVITHLARSRSTVEVNPSRWLTRGDKVESSC